MKILVVNAGSSSLKYQLFDMDNKSVLAKGQCERIGIADGKFKHTARGKEIELKTDMPDHGTAIGLVLKYLSDKDCGVITSVDEIHAVGHRIVNGGEVFKESCIMDKDKLKKLESLTEFAPLHNPPAVTVIKACQNVMGSVIPQITVFDTSFHQTMLDLTSIYPLPYRYYEKYGIRRFGAHGTSHKYVANECARLMNSDIKELKIVTCHLGNGSSITAVRGGLSIDTSMGFTPLAGLMMGTRCGDVDPSAIMYIMEKESLTPAQMSEIMNKQSGVLGLSEISSDFRDIEKAASEGSSRAQLVLDMFSYQVVKFIGAYTAAMGGLDAVVFTAGVGENNPIIREYVAQKLSYMGIHLNKEENLKRGVETEITYPDSNVHMFVIPTNEELAIALDTLELTKDL